MDEIFEEELFRFTRPRDGQYPRPWMTDLADPLSADCFLVGRNQRNGYAVEAVGAQSRHVDALLNRNGESCRGLYDALCETSPTRRNIDRMASKLRARGLRVLETNVICFSSPMSADLTAPQRDAGRAIFRWLAARAAPAVMIVHGAGAAKELARVDTGDAEIITMLSLAPPAFNRWSAGAEAAMERVADEAAAAAARAGA